MINLADSKVIMKKLYWSDSSNWHTGDYRLSVNLGPYLLKTSDRNSRKGDMDVKLFLELSISGTRIQF